LIALEVSSAAGKPPFGGVGGTIRALAGELLAQDRETEYALCYRYGRWRRGDLWRPAAANARLRVLVDPLNALILPRARLLHSMAVWLPHTPRVPKLVTIHDLNAVRNTEWVTEYWHEKRSAKIARTIARADHVMTYSEFTANEIREHYKVRAECVHPVLLGVDCERFAPPAPEVVAGLRAKHGDYVISIGLLTARKNFVTLIEAMARLPELRLVLVGRGSDGEAEVEAALDRTGMRARTLRMTGIPERELVALIGAARVCAVPSLYEGFGLTTLEAMACGTPVVCSSAASLPEAAGDAALLVDARSSEALEAALRRVVSDSALAADLRVRGLAHARAMSWSASARRLRAVYRAIADV
jgi:glycosyltransferase involved in cell wall biosynthesis